MRLRVSLCTAAVFLLAAWLALTTVGVASPGRFVLEVPATYLSVSQQFQPRLVSLADGAPPAPGAVEPDAAEAGAIEIDLLDSAGKRLASQQAALPSGATVDAAPIALPRPGRYQLRARPLDGTTASPASFQTIDLQAMAEPPAGYGGVVALASLGVAPGEADYLRQHGFAVQELDAATLPNAAARLILVGDPRLSGDGLAAQYAQLWRQVGAGAGLLLLEPPAPGAAAFWPLVGPLAPVRGACGDDLFADPLLEGLSSDAALGALLRPALAYDLAGPRQLDLYHWDGTRLGYPRPGAGYAGCHPVFSYRYGSGWVTVSTVPLLQHFQDARARLYLMNLIKAALRRKRYAPASPGLQWVMDQRLKALAQSPPNPLKVDATVFYRPSPAAAEPAAVLVPAATDGDPQSCWDSPATEQTGASLSLDLRRPLAVRALALNFGPDRARWPTALRLEGSPDGRHWIALPDAAIAANGALALPLPATPALWQAFRLTLAAAGSWRLCQFAAQ